MFLDRIAGRLSNEKLNRSDFLSVLCRKWIGQARLLFIQIHFGRKRVGKIRKKTGVNRLIINVLIKGKEVIKFPYLAWIRGRVTRNRRHVALWMFWALS